MTARGSEGHRPFRCSLAADGAARILRGPMHSLPCSLDTSSGSESISVPAAPLGQLTLLTASVLFIM